METKGFLEILQEGGEARRQALSGSHMVVGRASDADVQLDNPSISRKHAEFFADPFGRWWVRDLGSRNGTHVNGSPVDEALLKAGDVLQIEDFYVTVHFDGAAERPRQAAGGTSSGGSSLDVTLAVSDSDHNQVHRLQDMESPKIDRAHLSTLTKFSTELLSTADAEERVRKLCQMMVGKAFHGNSAAAIRVSKTVPVEEVEPALLCEHELSKYNRPDFEPYISRTMLRAAVQTEAPVVASNTSGGGGDALELSLAGNVQELSTIACPIGVKQDHLDLLYVCFPGQYGTGEWLALASLAAEQFQQAEEVWANRKAAEDQAVMEKDLARAERIQNGLIPETINIDGLEVSIGFEPCKWVGGDYVDVLQMPDGRVFLAVCDVCGKGLQAAIVTASLHTLVHMGVQANLTLEKLMARINNYLVDMLPDESFVTSITMILDPKTGEYEACNSGHPPGMIVGTAGKVRQLQACENPPWGYIEFPFETETGQLQPGELMCLFTDGLTELEEESGAMLGIAGTGDLLEKVYAAGGDIHGERDKLTELLDLYQGNAIRPDDRTFLVLRRK